MKLESIKVNGEELKEKQVADLFVNRPRNGYYVKGLAEGDEVIVSASNDGEVAHVEIKNNTGIIYFGLYKLLYNDKESAIVAQYLQLADFPIKLLFRVKRIGGYNRLTLKGFAFEGCIGDDIYTSFLADNDDEEARLREEVQKDFKRTLTIYEEPDPDEIKNRKEAGEKYEA